METIQVNTQVRPGFQILGRDSLRLRGRRRCGGGGESGRRILIDQTARILEWRLARRGIETRSFVSTNGSSAAQRAECRPRTTSALWSTAAQQHSSTAAAATGSGWESKADASFLLHFFREWRMTRRCVITVVGGGSMATDVMYYA